MGKKRKSDESRLDEVNRNLYSTFCNAANSLSQIYAHAMTQQKHAFQSGERHALEKVYHWIMRQHQEGSRMTVTDIVSYLQNEIDNGGDGTTSSPMLHCHQSLNLPREEDFNGATTLPSGSGARNNDGSGARNTDGSREVNSHDSFMDMHSDSPAHDS